MPYFMPYFMPICGHNRPIWYVFHYMLYYNTENLPVKFVATLYFMSS